MKKWAFIFILVAVIIVAGQFLPQKGISISSRNMEDNKENYQLIEFDKKQVHRGELILVNRDNPLSSDGIAGKLVTISAAEANEAGFALEKNEITLAAELLRALKVMLSAAQEDGVNGFLLTSGYRSLEQQAKLYEEQGSDYALPAGYSEHNSGLAVDIGSIYAKMETAEEGKWLREHAAEYGFILRYPPDKQHITGIQYEPWHFRYVGLPHSMIMMENDWVLEEYIQYIEENPHLKIDTKDGKFLIDYYNSEEDEFVKLPAELQYSISGDNKKGIIITTWKQ